MDPLILLGGLSEACWGQLLLLVILWVLEGKNGLSIQDEPGRTKQDANPPMKPSPHILSLRRAGRLKFTCSTIPGQSKNPVRAHTCFFQGSTDHWAISLLEMPLYQPPRTSLAHLGQSPKAILSLRTPAEPRGFLAPSQLIG